MGKPKQAVKKLFLGCLMVCVCALFNGNVTEAATSGNWSLNYIVNAPSGVSNQWTTVTLPYFSDGYRAYCSNISGSAQRRVDISSSDAGGMATVSITTTGYSKVWKMNSSSTGNVTFKVAAITSGNCTASGNISIYQ